VGWVGEDILLRHAWSEGGVPCSREWRCRLADGSLPAAGVLHVSIRQLFWCSNSVCWLARS
jgi:hypothetical protein